MSITLELSPGLEASLRDEAAREGVDTPTLVLRTLQQQFGSSATPSRESELLLQINEGPSEPVWRRYHELSAKRDAETLAPAEHEELISLSETIETADVQRLEYMAELAKLRGVTLRQIRDQLNIPNPNHNGEQPIA
jgi:hypothetical protein